MNSLNYDYLKLKKEEVIYTGSVCTNTRVLPLHTAYASRASARDHVTWNASARTATLITVTDATSRLGKQGRRVSYSTIQS